MSLEAGLMLMMFGLLLAVCVCGRSSHTHDAQLVLLGAAFCAFTTGLMLMMLGMLCWELLLVFLEGLLMLLMLGLLCWEQLMMLALLFAACVFGRTADADDAGLVVLGANACGFGREADAHDAGVAVLGVAVCVCGRAADVHDARFVVCCLPLW